MTTPKFTASPFSNDGITVALELPYAIRVIGAKTHNLKQISVEIPLGRLTVITGVSGSGKSSLAFDTIFAEGRHRYLSSISTRSREILQAIDRPDVDFIDGLPPVLCIEQKMRGVRKRSTVATASEIYEYLRLLFTRVGQLHCPDCRQPVTTQSRTSIVEQVLRFQDRQKVVVLAPIVRGRTGSHLEVFAKIVKDGYVRARVDGEIVDAASPPVIAKAKPHDIDIVVDRLILKEGIQSRLEESVDLALQLGQGQCVLSHEVDGGWQDRLYSSRLTCATCGTSFPTLESRSFSFNSAAGACQSCQGLGVVESDESDLACTKCEGTRLGPIPRSVLIDGTSITDFCRMSPTQAVAIVERWADFLSVVPTEDSFEERLPGTSNNNCEPSHKNANVHSDETSAVRRAATQYILPEIAARLGFLVDVGLDYLTLDRRCETLSAGEYQRTRLAACLGSKLTGVCYILDEPTAGLHSRDTDRLLQTLIRLRDDGNTVLLVEHDLDVIRKADYVIDLGPGAGVLGGQLLAAGTPSELTKIPESITGRFISVKENQGIQQVTVTNSCPSNLPLNLHPARVLHLTGASLHNLKDVTIDVPLQKIVCVTGVSGSGKTSLVIQTLVPAVRRALGERISPGGPFREISGFESLSRVVRIDQSPLGKSAQSSPATYSGLWDNIRQVFAKTKESRVRGFGARNFSLAVSEARCGRCAGRGMLPVDEQRFSDWTVRCPDCDGRRFAPAALSVRYRGQSVADVLEMSLSDAAQFFENFPKLARTLRVFNELGLGYLKLGQSATTLSGGEAQRIKLGTELAKTTEENGSTLFVLDEPTSGLHAADVQQLVHVLRRLVSEGHSVLVIEHNKELIASVDWIIEIGPDAGKFGGEVVSFHNVCTSVP